MRFIEDRIRSTRDDPRAQASWRAMEREVRMISERERGRQAERVAGLIRWETSLEFLADEEVIAAFWRAYELHDEPAMDRFSEEIEQRGLDL